MTWVDLIRLLRRSRQSENITNPPFAPPAQIRRGQRAVDSARVTDSIFVKIKMAVLDTLSVSDSTYYYLSKIQQSVGNVISVSDLVDYLIHEYVRRNATDNLSVSDAVNYVLGSIEQISRAASDSLTLSEELMAMQTDFAPSDTLSLSESVAYQLTTQQSYYTPNSYLVYNHNFQTISANLSVWWDNDTSTTYSLYYTPGVPGNPRYASLFFNTAISLPRTINIYVSNYASGKSLTVSVFYFDNYVSSTTLTPSSTGWASVTVPVGSGNSFDEIFLYTDSSTVGIFTIAEFLVLQ